MSTKGDWARPNQTSREETALRQEYFWGDMSLEEFNKRYKELEDKGLITRSGKVTGR